MRITHHLRLRAHRLISLLLLPTLEQVRLSPHKETGKPRLKKGNLLARESNKRLSQDLDPGRLAAEFGLYSQVPFRLWLWPCSGFRTHPCSDHFRSPHLRDELQKILPTPLPLLVSALL